MEENCPKAQVSHKFKRQGEGILRLLEPTSSTTPAQPPSQCRRLVLRQRGTWAILLNSPLWISKRFEKVPQMTGGFGVRFVGLSTTGSVVTRRATVSYHEEKTNLFSLYT